MDSTALSQRREACHGNVRNATTRSMIVLSQINNPNPLSPTAYVDLRPLALDDDGRILLNADRFDVATRQVTNTNLLLTPDGLSAAPLEVAAPEPGALAVMIAAIAGFVVHRARDRRRRLS